MKKLLFLLFAILCYSVVFSQTPITVTFKPDSIMGKDAVICERGGCIPNGGTVPLEDINFGNSTEIRANAWTWNAQGCPSGTERALLQFNQLSTIPASAEILSAELKLFGIPSSDNYQGNSCYSGSPYSSYCPNTVFIQRVTSPWEEYAVTWNNQPTTTTANQITIIETTAQWNWNFTDSSADLVAMVQEMVSNPNTNYGFMFKLRDEIRYRIMLFASSDHSNSALWPELTVTYTNCSIDTIVLIDTVYVEKPCPCEANFSYMVNTLNLSSYYFMASNPADRYIWTINGSVVSNASTFIYDFSEGNYEVCYKVINDKLQTECRKCINICIGKEANLQEKNIMQDEVIQEPAPNEKPIYTDSSTEGIKIEVYPNPTSNDWTVRITTGKEDAIKIQLTDMLGKMVYSDNKMLNIGVNSFNISTHNLISGNYGLQIIGKTIQSSKILIKN